MKAVRFTIVTFAAAALAGCAGDGFFGKKEERSQGSSASGSTQPSAQAAGAESPELVREVQQALKEKNIDAGPVDGVWGEQTQQAVREFQKKQGLQATGKLDRQTLSALGVEREGAGGSAATGGTSSGQTQQSKEQQEQKQ